jgi:hypothetical protein
MNLSERIISFIQLGEKLRNLSQDEKFTIARQAHILNNWFVEDNVIYALDAIAGELTEEKLNQWLSNYDFSKTQPKKVAIIMAGNIPLVGFHDLLCVLLAGHEALIKPSSQDTFLIRLIAKYLTEIDEAWQGKITITTEVLKNFQAVIATGSNNSALYFEYYFRKNPHIIRKNRTSVAIITGNETTEELVRFGEDVFRYYGLGCRNVSKVFVPEGYDFTKMLDNFLPWEKVMDNHKYKNNYDYNKSIYLVNRIAHLDTGYMLLTENQQLISPISVLFCQYYENQTDLAETILSLQSDLQCIVATNYPDSQPFGKAQQPKLNDYADGIDTMKFLQGL